MSGVAKDEINPSSPSEETASAVGDAEAGHVETSDASDAEKSARRTAPHLRVVTDNDDVAFTQEPVVPLIDQPNMRIGAVIKATRENLGYTLDQVSKEIRVHLSHLRAIEDMTPNLLGAPVYAKGYIKAYARHLGLDEQTTLERYLRECAILKDPVKQTIAPPSTGRKLPTAVPVFGFLIVALLAGAGYFFFANGDNATDTPQVADTGAPAPTQGAPSIGVIAAPAPSALPQLRIVALKREQLEVRSADGTKFVHRNFEPGESYPPRVGSGWTVSTPDGAAFEWRLGDNSLGLLAETGAVNAQSVDVAAQRPPIIAEAPPADSAVTADASPTPATPDVTTGVAPQRPLTSGATADFRSPPATTTTRPPADSTGPAPQRPRPRPRQDTPPVASAPPPAQAPQPGAIATPVQDPALAAYPDLLPSQ